MRASLIFNIFIQNKSKHNEYKIEEQQNFEEFKTILVLAKTHSVMYFRRNSFRIFQTVDTSGFICNISEDKDITES